MMSGLGMLLGKIVGAAIGALIAALIVQFATRLVARFKPPYGMAYLAAFIGFIVALLATFVIQLATGTLQYGLTWPLFILLLVVAFILQSGVYGLIIKDAEGHPLGFGKGALVFLIQLVIGTIILVALGLLFAVLGVHSPWQMQTP